MYRILRLVVATVGIVATVGSPHRMPHLSGIVDPKLGDTCVHIGQMERLCADVEASSECVDEDTCMPRSLLARLALFRS